MRNGSTKAAAPARGEVAAPGHLPGSGAATAVPSRRRELIVQAVVEAARSVMAHQLVRERRTGPADVSWEEGEALTTLRDALDVERRTRSTGDAS